LHTDLALDAIDFTLFPEYKSHYQPILNESVELVKCKYFTTNTLEINKVVEKDYNQLDSFVIYICLEGILQIETELGSEAIHKGETILIPAVIESVRLIPITPTVKLLEVTIEH